MAIQNTRCSCSLSRSLYYKGGKASGITGVISFALGMIGVIGGAALNQREMVYAGAAMFLVSAATLSLAGIHHMHSRSLANSSNLGDGSRVTFTC